MEEILWTSGFFNERFPAPISPLGWALVGPLILDIALRDPLRFLGYPQSETVPLVKFWRGHPYSNALAFQIFYKVFPDWILPEDTYRYFVDGDASIRKHAPYPTWVDAPRFVFSLLRAFFSDPFNVSPLSNYRHWARYICEHDHRVEKLRERLAALRNADTREIFSALEETENIHRAFLRIHRWSLMDADLTFGLLKRLTRAWISAEQGDEIAARLVADVPNKTLQVDQALHELANSKFQLFLAEHGHRSFSLDIAVPTFAEEPEQVMRLMQSTKDPRPQTENLLPSSVLRPRSFVKRAIFNWILNLAKNYVAMREDQRYYWQKALAISRQLYLMLADRLMADGVITNRADIFYATHPELQNYFDNGMSFQRTDRRETYSRGTISRSARNDNFKELPKAELTRVIAERQAEWQVYQREYEQSPTESYPSFLRGDVPLQNGVATLIVASSAVAHPTREWHGRAISPGKAQGTARVVQSASDLSRVQPGDILIAPSTDPGWTPVFARIAGLVVARGGVLSHSAVVAREYHIPGVAGIPNIVSEIRDGQVIQVDGSRGIVSLIVG
jgi:phosphohistidine swiveling domain-containing protein